MRKVSSGGNGNERPLNFAKLVSEWDVLSNHMSSPNRLLNSAQQLVISSALSYVPVPRTYMSRPGCKRSYHVANFEIQNTEIPLPRLRSHLHNAGPMPIAAIYLSVILFERARH